MSLADPMQPSPPIPFDDALEPETPYEDDDQRIGGNDEPVLLEQLHAEAEQVKSDRKTTRYEVWLQIEADDGSPSLWSPLVVAVATSADDAIRQVASEFPQHFGVRDVVRAIPVRNITQRTLSVETATRLRLS